MKNGYSLLTILTTTLNESENIINDILIEGKELFSQTESSINIAIGIVNEIKEILLNIDEEVFILNKKLYDTILPILNYSKNLFNDYKFVNAYKLYDTLKYNITTLKNYLNMIED